MIAKGGSLKEKRVPLARVVKSVWLKVYVLVLIVAQPLRFARVVGVIMISSVVLRSFVIRIPIVWPK